MPLKILDVGQCGFDGPRMKELFETELDAEVTSADTADDAQTALAGDKFDIVLVNRIFAADGGSGLEFIDAVAHAENMPPVMLVSDQADAQAKAEKAGAVKGFGKAELDAPATLKLIRHAAGRS